jgi:hypothetical protein
MTGRSPMRSVRAPHGTSVSMPPPVTAANARPTSPRLSPNSLRTAGPSEGSPIRSAENAPAPTAPVARMTQR